VNFTEAQILAARATSFVAPVVRVVVGISRTTEWRQNTGKIEGRRLLPLNPGDHREIYLGQTVVDHVRAQCVDAGLPPVSDESILAALLVAREEHEHKLAERKATREAEQVAA
jgi:hypothetical protein